MRLREPKLATEMMHCAVFKKENIFSYKNKEL
jgi:hypothetical protein